MVQSKGKKKIKKHGLLPMLSQACMLQITRTCNFCEKLLYIPYHSRPAGHYCYLPALCLLTFRKRFSEGKPSCSPAYRAHPAEHPAAATALQHLLPFPALRPAEPTLPLTEPGIGVTSANPGRPPAARSASDTAAHSNAPHLAQHQEECPMLSPSPGDTVSPTGRAKQGWQSRTIASSAPLWLLLPFLHMCSQWLSPECGCRAVWLHPYTAYSCPKQRHPDHLLLRDCF